jgi:hypothetical protein
MSKPEVWIRVLAPVGDERKLPSQHSQSHEPKIRHCKGQQGPGRRSTIAKFDHSFCVYVLRLPNCSTIQFIATRNSSKPPRLALRIWHILPFAPKVRASQGVFHCEFRPHVCVYVLRPPNCSTSQFIATRNWTTPPDWHCASGTFFHLRPK